MTGDRSVASVRGDIFHHPETRSSWTTRSHAFAGCSQSGTGFPDGRALGKSVPEFAIGVGWSFPTEPQAETASHSEREFWDMLSGCKKGHMTWPSSYMCCGCSHEKPRLNTEASARAARNVRFIASSARKEGHLMWPSSCAGLSEQGTLRSVPPGRRTS